MGSFNLLLLSLLSIFLVHGKTHWHRYMLSDYKAQHNPNTQMDYKKHKAPHYAAEIKTNRSGARVPEPQIKMTTTEETALLHELLVRIYDQDKFLCMGTLIADRLIITAATCFINVQNENLTIKTSTNEILQAYPQNSTDDFLLNQDTLLRVLELTAPHSLPNKDHNLMVQLCSTHLKPHDFVTLPTYARSRHTVDSKLAEVLLLTDCKESANDANGTMLGEAVVCVANKKRTKFCQNTIGTPLIYNGMVCGVNIMGHNCPKALGADLYAGVFSANDYVRSKFDFIRKSNLEDVII